MTRRKHLSDAEKARRAEQERRTPHKRQTPREKRREAIRDGVLPVPEFKLRYDMEIPGGLLRDPNSVRLAGTLVGDSEAMILRNVIIKTLEAFGYVTQARAAAGVLAEAINAFPKAIRGNLAVGLIKGTGILVTTDMLPVCKDCRIEQSRTLAPEQPDDADEDAEPLMLDTTPHAPECHFHRITDDHGKPLNPVEYVDEEAIMILQPPHWEPLDQEQGDPRRLPNEPEAGYTYEDTDGNVIDFPAPSEEPSDAGTGDDTAAP